MFLFTWFNKLYLTIVNFNPKSKDVKKELEIKNYSRIASQKVRHLKTYTYWPVAQIKENSSINAQEPQELSLYSEIKLPNKFNKLIYNKRIINPSKKSIIFAKPIRLNKQEISTEML